MTDLHSSGKDGIREDGSFLELVKEPNEENGNDEDEERSEKNGGDVTQRPGQGGGRGGG